ncbi:signal peptidase I [Thermoflavimicrobium daqui]|jgi:signal peptidase I|uniref:Signal peptidase I n=1 Tax=Thermoflavimicrobium daqui TaxID=2137476 RepID=A0A364K2X0_9BACL|nr:signal peptidase I [Thermoflavimicrobium daqui]RAL23163.1 signal peptidase I [Thermoflavimicrobium daqui]
MNNKNAPFPYWIIILLITLAIAYFIRHDVFTPYEVQGKSMYPTLYGGEILIVNKWIYQFDEVEFGEIIVFHMHEPGKKSKDFIKRVIGLPGDHIIIQAGKLIRNGELLQEDYINEPMNNDRPVDITIPKEKLFVLGDNRNNSKDSREIGLVDLHDVVGRVEVIIYPWERMRCLSDDDGAN